MDDRRSKATPMDFTYDNVTGPTDMTSPFMSVGRSAMKRTHSTFNSPSKTQSFGLREPNGNSHFFNYPPGRDKPLPSDPPRAFDPKFNTPRKMEVDFSSGGETPDTDLNSEANTPEVIRKKSASSVFRATPSKTSPTKEKRNSIMGKLGRMMSSPGRGEIAKKDHYSTKSEKIVRRRRQKELDKALARKDSIDDGDKGSKKSKKGDSKEKPRDQKGAIYEALSFMHEHPNLPHIFSWYTQFLFNGFLVSISAYFIWSFVRAIMADIEDKRKEVTAKITIEMTACATQYVQNRCDPATRMPALENVCNEWSRCMNQDASAVGRASVSAHTLAQIFNSLIEPISYKAMFFTLAILFGFFGLSNTAFSILRRKTAPDHGQQSSYMQAPPATPQRFPSGQWNTPYHGGNGQEPMPSLPPGQDDGRQRALGW